jgi:putative membrane protein
MKTTTRLLSAGAIAVAAAVSPALAADTAQDFVDKAAASGSFEVESSQLALRMSKDPDVKKFADTMVADHGKANAELEVLAKEQGLTVPAKLDPEHAALIEELEKAGAQFDAPYIKAQLNGHAEAVKMFQQYADGGDNKELQTFAVKALPTLRMHFDMIEQLGDRVGATK